MKIVEQTTAALGSPIWAESLEGSYGPGALIARWHHGSVRVAISEADATRVVLSLSSTQQVHHVEENRTISARGLPGHVSVFPAGVPTETVIEGEADVVQIFLPPQILGRAASRHPRRALFESTREELKLAAIQLFVAVRHDDWKQRGAAELRLEQIVRKLLSSRIDGAGDAAFSELTPLDVRRVERLIDEALSNCAFASLTLKELAAAVNLSVSHFIRAFQNAAGTTPHQLVMTRRREQAMALLRNPHMHVADVAYATGYGSAAHFIASFKQRLGVTPAAYQRAVQGYFSIPGSV